MNSQKLCIWTAAAAATPAALPSSAPSAKPARRPKRCMNSDAGISVTAEPTSVMAMGNVAKLGSGASSRPTTPEAVTTRTETVWDRPCAVASSRTLRFSAVICCHDSSKLLEREHHQLVVDSRERRVMSACHDRHHLSAALRRIDQRCSPCAGGQPRLPQLLAAGCVEGSNVIIEGCSDEHE